MKIVLASRNPKKIKELRALLSESISDIEILSLDDVSITEEIEENGETFEENALIKAHAAAKSGYIGVGDDSGLTVDALNGDPGIYSARYAERAGYMGEDKDAANNALLMEKLAKIPAEKRTAAFVCAIACVFPDGEEFTVRGEAKGRILCEYRGSGGFGYDPLFFYEPLNKTFGELTAEEKNKISHRALAIQKLAGELASRVNRTKQS